MKRENNELEATWCVTSAQVECSRRQETLVVFVKPGITETCDNVPQSHSSHSVFALEYILIFRKMCFHVNVY